jgi:hypothetical protein
MARCALPDHSSRPLRASTWLSPNIAEGLGSKQLMRMFVSSWVSPSAVLVGPSGGAGCLAGVLSSETLGDHEDHDHDEDDEQDSDDGHGVSRGCSSGWDRVRFPAMRWGRWIAAAGTLLALAGCASSSSSSSSAENDPAKNASESNVPRAGSKGSVEVDNLRWRLRSATAASAIGESEFGGATANGVYVVVQLDVTNHKTESATLTEGTVSLIAGKSVYSADAAASAELPGKSLLIADLGPNVSMEAGLAFDVAPAVLRQQPELRFNELGFGDTHGYIVLPTLR